MSKIGSVVSPSTVLHPKPAARRPAASAVPQRAKAPVSYVDTVKRSGNRKIDALLAGGNRWWHGAGADGSVPSAVAKHSLTFSFIADAGSLGGTDAAGFQALSSDQQDRVRAALAYVSTVANVSFTEVASGGDIQYGSNNQSSSAGYSYYPNEGTRVFLANNQSSFGSDWSKGTYEWETLLHETGHALGLKHPENVNATGGGTPPPYLPKAQSHRGNTIMSYNDAPYLRRIVNSDGSFTRTYVNPGSFQTDDIMALQYLYGAPTSGAASYSWATDGIFSETVYNADAGSSLDLSNQTAANVIDLRAGHFSSIALRDAYADTAPYDKKGYAGLKASNGKKLSALLGIPTYTGAKNLCIAPGSSIDAAKGGSGNDIFIANDGTNVFDGSAGGNDSYFLGAHDATVVGGSGDDTVYLKKTAGAKWTLSSDNSQLTLTKTDKKTHVVTTLATVSLTSVEHVKFWNGKTLKAAGAPLLGSPVGVYAAASRATRSPVIDAYA